MPSLTAIYCSRRVGIKPATRPGPQSRAARTSTSFPRPRNRCARGFVRIINHSSRAGEVHIDPVDDSGRPFDTIVLSIDANWTVHFNSTDLEMGNPSKGSFGQYGFGARRLAARVFERPGHRGSFLYPHHGRLSDVHARMSFLPRVTFIGWRSSTLAATRNRRVVCGWSTRGRRRRRSVFGVWTTGVWPGLGKSTYRSMGARPGRFRHSNWSLATPA